MVSTAQSTAPHREHRGPLVLVVPPFGGGHTEHLPENPAAMLSRLNGLVGGYIEAIAKSGGDWVAYINEEGKLHGLPFNTQADAMARALGFPFMDGDHLVGTVVFLGRAPGDPDEHDVPEHVLVMARAAGVLDHD